MFSEIFRNSKTEDIREEKFSRNTIKTTKSFSYMMIYDIPFMSHNEIDSTDIDRTIILF